MTSKAALIGIIAISTSFATHASDPWKATLRSNDAKLTLKIDLHTESIEVPDMEMYGPMHGYMKGDTQDNLYGTWTITSCSIQSPKKATLRLSNDLGSETQQATLTLNTDSTYTLKLDGQMVMKRVVEKRKLTKIANSFNFTKSK